ncbi:magnesium transporter [Frateuria aurantia]
MSSTADSHGVGARRLVRLAAVQDVLRRYPATPREESGESATVPPDAQAQALRNVLQSWHPADIAYVLECLPLEQRRLVWQQVPAEQDGEILLEVTDAVRESLIADMDRAEILEAVEPLDADELADLVEDLPEAVLPELMASLDVDEREQVQAALSYRDDQVGAVMEFEMVAIDEQLSLGAALAELRKLEALPPQTDKLFVINPARVLTGVLPLERLLLGAPEQAVNQVMAPDVNTFRAEDDIYHVAHAFERYDLISAPVVDAAGRLVGRLTVDAIVDVIRAQGDSEARSRGGLREEEDIFASVWKSVQNRWAWLAINLVTAFVASRVIGLFEGAIEKLVALAALMPIVAGIGGNSGNQTITMIVRALALEQITPGQLRRLWAKELQVAIVNGLLWGGVIGLVAWALYHNAALGLVMTAAMTLNLLLAAFAGVGIPMLMARLGRDPALGSSVLITALTDSGGFFIFLGLATLFLM